MKCNKCEAELEEGAEFCPYCGAEATPAQELPEEAAPVEEVAGVAAAEAETLEETVSADDTVSAEEIGEEQEADVPAQEPVTEENTTPIVEGKLTGGKIAMLVALGVAAIAIIVALIVSGLGGNDVDKPADDPTTESTAATGETDASENTEASEATIPADGDPDDVTCKGSYTATDDEIVAAKDTVVATMGDAELTIAELQVYYWMQFYDFIENYGDYASYFGLDYTQPLDTQISPDGTSTWQQYFLGSALDAWHTYSAISTDALASGWELSEDYSNFLDTLPESLEESAASAGYASAQEMLEYDMGKGVSIDAYVSYMREYYVGGIYYGEQSANVTATDDEINLYYSENAVSYESSGIEKNDEQVYVDARHILVMPQGGTTDDSGNTTYSEEEWETCRASAQAILDEWKAGDANEESFAALANARSEDGGSNTNGGLYENIYEGQMVEPFESWCFDSSRQYGDTGLVQTDYGYHVMYYVGSTPVWYATARDDLISEKCAQIIDGSKAAHEMTVDYSAIILNSVSFG